MTLPLMIIGLMRQLESRRKLMCISLHLVGLSLVLWAMAKLWMSEATTVSKLWEFLGIISRAVVSSMYLMRSCQSDSSLFVITVKRITPSLNHWGTPVSVHQSDRVLPILTASFLDVKNAAIQDKRTGWTSRSASSCINIEWSIKSNPLEKSAKKVQADASPLSNATPSTLALVSFFFFNSGQFLAWWPKFFREWSTVLFHSNDIDDVYLGQTCVHHPGYGYCIGNNTCQFHLPLVYPNLLFTVMTKRKMSRHQTFCIAVQESVVSNRKHSRITQPSSKSEIHFEISSLTHLKLRFEKCRPVDSKTSTSKSTRFAHALASVILAGKGVSRQHSTTSSGENKTSNVGRFIILRSGKCVTSFTKDNSANFCSEIW